MATKQATVDYLLDQMAKAGDVTARKMFGEYALYLNGKVIALVCDDQLYIKPTESGRGLLSEVDEAPPYPGAKNYFRIPGDQWEDRDVLVELVQATERELPVPKKKQRKNA